MSTTDTGTPTSGNGSIAEAAAAFERILDGKSPTQADEGDAPEDPADEAEALDAASETDETPSDEEGAEDEEATANDDESDEETEQEGERLITIKIDGNVMRLPESEVAKGYQRQADYSRHMAALSQERQVVQQERAQYAQLLPALMQQLHELQPQEPDWERLYAEDPLAYVKAKEDWRSRQEQMQAAAIEMQRLGFMQEQEQAQHLQARVQQGREHLKQYNPAWKDKATWDRDRVQLREYGKAQGYSDEEISRAYDPRAVRIMHKAMLYDRLMSKNPQPVRQNSPKPAPAGTAQSIPARKHTDHSKAKMRLAKTGSISDAAKVFEGLL